MYRVSICILIPTTTITKKDRRKHLLWKFHSFSSESCQKRTIFVFLNSTPYIFLFRTKVLLPFGYSEDLKHAIISQFRETKGAKTKQELNSDY